MIDLRHGDCLEVMRTLADNSVDSVVTDPPYHLTTSKKGGTGTASVNLESPYGRARIGTGNGAGGFMGKAWDGGDIAFQPATWVEAMRVLKPGGYLLAFGGTRTYHRMACAIEDGGFEIRDQIGWAYGSGFPKSHNGPWGGTALKPAWEPICVARKPLIGTVEQNWKEHGTGALNIDGCRIEGASTLREKAAGRGQFPHEDDAWEPKAVTVGSAKGRWPANLIHDGSDEVVALFPREAGAAAPVTVRNGDKFRTAYGAFKGDRDEAGSTFQGDTGSAARFFANFPQEAQCQNQSPAPIAQPCSSLQNLLDSSVQSVAAIWPSLAGVLSSQKCLEPSTPVTPTESRTIRELVITATAPIGSESSRESRQEKRSQCGSHVSVAATRNQTGTTTITASLCRSDGSAAHATFSITPTNLELGVAACRFNYCAKADRADRNDGIQDPGQRLKRGATLRDVENLAPAGNHHPTVKPTDLMRYLCRLVTPAGGLVLDPFMGSGSTGRGAVLEGFRFIGIEREAEYIEIARARIDSARRQGHQPDLLEQAA